MKKLFRLLLSLLLGFTAVVAATSAGFSARTQKTLQLLVTSPTLETADTIVFTNQGGVEERLVSQGLPWSFSYPINVTRDWVAAIGATKAAAGIGAQVTLTWSLDGNIIRQETFTADNDNLGSYRSIVIERE